jgi:membrane protein
MTLENSRPPSLRHPKSILELLMATVHDWQTDKASRLGAALAYYMVFSLPALLIIVITIVGVVFGQQAAQAKILSQIQGVVGQQGADLVKTMIESANQPRTGTLATVVGLIMLLIGGFSAYGQLQDALNTIWEVAPKPGRGLKGILQDRLASSALVLGTAFLLLVSLVISAGLSATTTYLNGVFWNMLFFAQLLNVLISFGVITFLFAMIFKYLPDAKIAWRDVWIGAILTALLFTLGKFLIGLYLGNAGVTTAYGAAGSLVIILLWIYYSAQILLFGAEFTQVYANRYGSKVMPTDNAVAVTALQRAHEGTPGNKQGGAAKEERIGNAKEGPGGSQTLGTAPRT